SPAISANSSVTWAHSSRVGTSTRAAGRGSDVSSRSTIGIANASVLPEPVGLFASTSPPWSASGITSDWIWNGVSMPRRASTSAMASDTPRERKSVKLSQLLRTSRSSIRGGDCDLTGARLIRTPYLQGSSGYGRSPGGASSSRRSRCSSWATRSSSSSHSSRVTRPASRASSWIRRRELSPTRRASPRQREPRSSTSERSSSSRGPRIASRRSRSELPGSAMRPGVAARAAALALRRGIVRHAVAVAEDALGDVDRSLGGRLRRCGLFGASQQRVRLRALRHGLAPAARILGLALLPQRQHRRRDEDRRVRTGGDADEQREREVLQRRAAEEEQRADRQQRDERRRQ